MVGDKKYPCTIKRWGNQSCGSDGEVSWEKSDLYGAVPCFMCAA